MIERLDAFAHKRSLVAWVLFRAVAGLLLALGFFLWISLWFERGLWLGVAQAAIITPILVYELRR